MRALEKSCGMNGDSVWILGGEDIYRQAIPIANRLILTLVKCRPRGDTFFPDFWRSYFTPSKLIHRQEVDSEHEFAFDIIECERTRQ
jgi:dihydrofolate reductase